MTQPVPSEEWKVIGVVGGSTHEFTFTDYDTIWPENAARTLARALGAITREPVRVYHRRTTHTDWIGREVATVEDRT